MNIWECDIMNILAEKPFVNQRALSGICGYSLGTVNRSLRNLVNEGYLSDELQLTDKAVQEFRDKAPRNAVILAAGYGMRMIPVNMETPKALVEVHGEPLIERIIRQLHEAGIREIYVVAGFMKEQLEYLIDEFNVELIVNPDYAAKNNLHSLKLAAGHLANTYVIPCDIWCDKNPFHKRELYSWYMVSDETDDKSPVRVNRKLELVSVQEPAGGNAMIGISYLLEEQASVVREEVYRLCRDGRNDGQFWEKALYDRDRMIVQARVVPSADAIEINTYEQLRELDTDSNQLKSAAIDVIAGVFHVKAGRITGIRALKKGMTNRSFLFTCEGQRYIMRIPGEGTGRLINREGEARVYHKLAGTGICDDVVYISPDTGYKITKYMEGTRNCDPADPGDVARCMKKLRDFHELGLAVEHDFDIFGQIEFYESLWNGLPSAFRDYQRTKEQVFGLRPYIEAHIEKRTLTHIDAVPDNFLFVRSSGGGQEEIRLIDWEYAAMQDPHVDIAMFGIYSLYDRQQMDGLIDLYFPEGYPAGTKIKIYCYIAACGLLWSNWCEYKRSCGVEFREYSLRQYRYAKEYYKIVREELERLNRR